MNLNTSIAYWADLSWRKAFAEQQADELLRLRLLLQRRIGWLRFRLGREPLEGRGDVVITDGQVRTALQPPNPAAEYEFYLSDSESSGLGTAVANMEAQLGERSAVMAAADTPFPIDRLAGVLNLDDFARDVLMLALAPELDPEFERMYAYAQDDATRRYATPVLATALFSGAAYPRRRPAPAFHPDAPLFRLALLRPEPAPEGVGAAVRPLRVEHRLLWYLQAVDVSDAINGVLLEPLRFVPTAEGLQRKADSVIVALRRLAGLRAPVVNLIGQNSGQASTLATAIAAGMGMTTHRVVLEPSVGAATVLARLDRESILRNSLYLFDLSDPDKDPDVTAVRLIEDLRAPVALLSRHPVHLERPGITVAVPPLQPASQRTLWQQELREFATGIGDMLDRIVHHFALEPDAIVRVAASARGAARLRGEPVNGNDVWKACRQYGRRKLGGLAERIEPYFGWDDIVVSGDVRRQLEEIVQQVRHRALVYEQWRFGDKLVRGRGITALFAGPSGTGKTMAAEILSGELDLDLYRIDLAGVVNKYIGETEKNLRRVFDAAEKSGAVLFFDEADALFGKRSEVRDSHDRYANIEIDYLLQRMEAYTGLAILATNRKSVLDRAFLRRLRFLVDFPFPAADSRLRIWQKVLPPSAPIESADFGALARLELAGANIQSIALNAAFLAAADGKVITMGHLMHAAAREYTKLDKTPTEAEFGRFPRSVQP